MFPKYIYEELDYLGVIFKLLMAYNGSTEGRKSTVNLFQRVVI